MGQRAPPPTPTPLTGMGCDPGMPRATRCPAPAPRSMPAPGLFNEQEPGEGGHSYDHAPAPPLPESHNDSSQHLLTPLLEQNFPPGTAGRPPRTDSLDHQGELSNMAVNRITHLWPRERKGTGCSSTQASSWCHTLELQETASALHDGGYRGQPPLQQQLHPPHSPPIEPVTDG